MAKRGRLEIIRDILAILKNNHSTMRPTPLLRKSNLSSSRFKEYLGEMKQKKFVEVGWPNEKIITLTNRGERFLEKYKTIVEFIDEFEL